MSLNMMERPPSFEYLCRVCAANTKGKNSVPECVSILKTPALKDKIEKFLYLSISDEDILPKVLCKACFRQVEATASLSKIAKHTQKVFRDFISNTIPSAHALQEESSTEKEPSVAATVTDFRATILAAQESTPTPSVVSEPLPPVPRSMPKTSSSSQQHEDVVVNVSVSDPLTRETQHKMISASQRRNTSLDSRFTPKSIAQRGFTSTPKQQENNAVLKKPSPPGVINFFRPQQQQVTAYSGGYVIGRPDSQPSNSTNSSTTATVLQQKRRNLKMALNNIKSVNSGQISLLKVSQKPSQSTVAAMEVSPIPPPPGHSAEQRNVLHDDDESPVTELPERMIIAATKNQKQRSVATKPSPEPPTGAIDMSQSQKPSLPDEILLGKVIKDSDLLRLILKALKWPVTKHTLEQQIQCLKNSKFSQIMSDPNLLQDTDLTQIMAPYLAPVSHASQMLQQQQQKQMAAAAAAASLVQPILPIVPSNSETQTVGVATGIPYKLPAETSVQLVPASTEDDTSAKSSDSMVKRNARSQHFKTPPRKLRRVNQKERNSAIVISDEETGESANDAHTSHSSVKASSSAQFRNNNALLLAQPTAFPGSASITTEAEFNEAIYALLERQRAAYNRAQRAERRKRSNSSVAPVGSGAELAFDTDDIVLMEPDLPEIPQPQDKESNPTVTSSSIEGGEALFAVPNQAQKPIITRPIIKRRKTVIQTSTSKDLVAAATPPVEKPVPSEDASVVTSSATMTKLTANNFDNSNKPLPPMPPLQKKPSPNAENSIITLYSTTHSNTLTTATQTSGVVAKATETLVTVNATLPTTTSVNSNAIMTDSQSARNKQKQHSSKAALGQQLLEAIGLQKSTSDDKANQKSDLNPRESVQQIRSALKKSLQEAQKQSARKQEEPIKQDADSTTKNVVKEIVVEPRRRICSLENVVLDVEQEINKITLVLQSKKADPKPEQITEKLSEASSTRKPGIRRKIVPAARDNKMAAIFIEDEQGELKAIEQLNELAVSKTQDKIGDKPSEKAKGDKKDHERSASSTTSPPKPESVSSTEPAGGKRGRKPKKREESPKITARSRSQADKMRRRSASSPRKTAMDREDKESDKASTSPTANEKTSPLRPTRVSKTLSKYYIGPCGTGAARRGILTRSTRKRN